MFKWGNACEMMEIKEKKFISKRVLYSANRVAVDMDAVVPRGDRMAALTVYSDAGECLIFQSAGQDL